MGAPIFKQVANLWSLWDYPSAAEPWSLEQQLDAVQGAGGSTGLRPSSDHGMPGRKPKNAGLFMGWIFFFRG